MLIFNRGTAPAEVRVSWADVGLVESAAFYVGNLWEHQTTGPQAGAISVTVAPNDVALLRVSKTNSFPIPPIIVADSYLLSLRAAGPDAQKLTGTITVWNSGSVELPLWKVQPGLPSWLSVAVTKDGNRQSFTNTVSTAELKRGRYHALVGAENTEPISGKPISVLYYDVDLGTWSLVDGDSYENCNADGGANITLLVYFNGNIYF